MYSISARGIELVAFQTAMAWHRHGKYHAVQKNALNLESLRIMACLPGHCDNHLVAVDRGLVRKERPAKKKRV